MNTGGLNHIIFIPVTYTPCPAYPCCVGLRPIRDGFKFPIEHTLFLCKWYFPSLKPHCKVSIIAKFAKKKTGLSTPVSIAPVTNEKLISKPDRFS